MDKSRACAWCGKEFTLKTPRSGRALYCSPRCHADALNLRRLGTRRYVPRTNHKIICARCGSVFFGKYCRKYCDECLWSGDGYMRKLREARSVIE